MRRGDHPGPTARRAFAGIVVCAAIAAGCGWQLPGAADGEEVGAPCHSTYSTDRCEALIVGASISAGVEPAVVGAIRILPAPSGETGGRNGGRIRVLLLVLGREPTVASVSCGESASVPWCMDEPRLSLLTPTNSGYFDVPYGKAPFKGIDEAAAAAAVDLVIDRVEIPIKDVGVQRVRLGEAALANGIIRSATAELPDPWPDNVVLRNSVRLELVSAAGGEVIRNIYEHAWRPGVERVEVFLVFEPLLVRPGAFLTLANVVVR